VYFFHKYWKENSISFLYISAVFFAIANGYRYEGWFFIPVMACLVYFGRKNIYRAAAFAAVSSFVPFLWMLGNYFVKGNAFQFLINHLHDPGNSTYMGASLALKARMYAGTALDMFSQYRFFAIFFIIFLAAGIINSFRYNRQKFYMFFVFTAPFILLALTTPSAPEVRKFFWIKIVSLPYIYTGLKALTGYRRYAPILFLGAGIVFMLDENGRKLIANRGLHYPAYNMSRWMKANIKGHPNMILGNYRWLGKFMIAQDGLGYDFSDIYINNNVYEVFDYKDFLPDKNKIAEFIDNRNPEYLIYDLNGKLPSVFGFSENKLIEHKFGRRFKRLVSDGSFAVYSITG
jgi:hypothetical protein